jgi:hypothetical protein
MALQGNSSPWAIEPVYVNNNGAPGPIGPWRAWDELFPSRRGSATLLAPWPGSHCAMGRAWIEDVYRRDYARLRRGHPILSAARGNRLAAWALMIAA